MNRFQQKKPFRGASGEKSFLKKAKEFYHFDLKNLSVVFKGSQLSSHSNIL